MKKSDIIFYAICLMAGLLNPCSGGVFEFLYVIGALSLAVTACVLYKNKYEKPKESN